MSRRRTESQRSSGRASQRYVTLLEKLHEGLIVIDTEENVTFANPAAERIFGVSKGMLVGNNLHTHLDEPAWQTHLIHSGLRQLGQTTTYELALKGSDGKQQILSWSVSPEYDDNDELIGSFGLIQDITKRKLAEQALVRSEERFRGLLESTNDWIWEVNREGIYTYASPQVEALLGYRSDEIIGKTPFDLMPPTEAVRVASIFKELSAAGQALIEFENINLHKDGHLVILSTSGIPVLDDQGRNCGYRGIDRDITKRKQAELSMQESEQRLRALSDASFEAIFISEKGICVDQNEAAERMFGYTRAEAIGRPGTDWILPEHRDLVMKNMLSGRVLPYDVTALRKDGTTFRAEIQARMAERHGQQVRFTALRDITERKKAEAEREQLISELGQALSDVKALKGLLPICSSCKNVRDDEGYWQRIESYIMQHSDAEFTHSICPSCAKELYPDIDVYPEK